ncbi:MAG: aspartate kinase [Chitinophagaceae bacterium]|nr:aspartate kinase [Chitinophagaceae bacterium]
MMEVFKFGGASINSIERIQNVVSIVKNHEKQPLLLVVSAMGKTTNALEKVAEAFFENKQGEALQLFEQIKTQHLNMAKYLLVKEFLSFSAAFGDICTEAEWLLHDRPVRGFDYYYDQIVCLGELFSTLLIAHTFRENGLPAEWLDVRDVLKTDNNFRDAGILWEETGSITESLLKPMLQNKKLVVTQGFIGCTDENESTTLGREGSDYSAAIFANLLRAEKVTIWKDVDAVLNADPKQFPEAVPMANLNYDEVVEMAYYGAQVIHPKTIKPLFNAGIPLQVKSFLDPNLKGTLIEGKKQGALPPILIRKSKQVLLTFHTKDFSFVGEKPVGQWYAILEKLHMRPNLTQNGAVRLMAVFDDHPEKIGQLAGEAESIFDVIVQKDLTLFTIRHYTQEAIQQYLGNKKPFLVQQTPETVQYLFAE